MKFHVAVAKKMANNFRGYFFGAHCILELLRAETCLLNVSSDCLFHKCGKNVPVCVQTSGTACAMQINSVQNCPRASRRDRF